MLENFLFCPLYLRHGPSPSSNVGDISPSPGIDYVHFPPLSILVPFCLSSSPSAPSHFLLLPLFLNYRPIPFSPLYCSRVFPFFPSSIPFFFPFPSPLLPSFPFLSSLFFTLPLSLLLFSLVPFLSFPFLPFPFSFPFCLHPLSN